MTRWLVFCTLLCTSTTALCAQQTGAVDAMLDRIEKAHRTHDIGLLSGQYSDRCVLFVGETPSLERGAFVLGKDRALVSTKEQVWGSAGLAARKTSNRRIALRDDLAFITMTVTDSFKDGRSETSEQFAIAARESGGYRVCFSLPALVRGSYVVTSVDTGSISGKAGLKPNDIITHFNGETVDAFAAGSDIRSAMKAAADGTVALTISRSGADSTISVPASLPGAVVQAVLEPRSPAAFIGPGRAHPVRDLLAAEVDSIRTGDLTAYCESVCGMGFFSYRRESKGGTELICGSGAAAMITNQNVQSRKALNPETVRLVDTQVIATPNIALGTATVEAADRAGKPVKVLTRLHVYARNGTQWLLAADLVERFRLGTAGPPVQVQSAKETQEAKRQLEGRLVGIGVQLGENPNGAMIRDVVAAAPAEKAGLRSGEVILSVDGRPVKGMPINDVVSMIKGEEGSKVTLEVADRNSAVRKVELIRAEVMLQNVKPMALGDEIGCIKFTTFDSQAATMVRSALSTSLSPEKARGIVVDLRGTAGGLYPQVVEVARALIRVGERKILWIARQKGKEPTSVEVQPTSDPARRYVVLVDARTSGGAELLAEALRQCSGAVLLGAKTAGGAMLKERIEDPDGTSRLVQTGDFLFPHTGKTGTDGVTPDIAVPEDSSPEQTLEMGKQKLIELLAGQN